MTFKKWLIELFKDERGSTSIKPVIAFLLSLCLGFTLIANSYSSEDIKPSDALVDAVVIALCVAIGGDSVDKFSKRGKSAPADEPVE